MRNWNVIADPVIIQAAESFYRTYEELKQAGFSEAFGESNVVFIVPMRNWNINLRHMSQQKAFPVFIVPMRNWNAQKVAVAVAGAIVFIVPMRNWNFSPGD